MKYKVFFIYFLLNYSIVCSNSDLKILEKIDDLSLQEEIKTSLESETIFPYLSFLHEFLGDNIKGQQFLNNDFYNLTNSPIHLNIINNKKYFFKILDKIKNIINVIIFYSTLGFLSFIKEKCYFVLYNFFPNMFINTNILKEYALSQRHKVLDFINGYSKNYQRNIQDLYENVQIDYFREVILDLVILGGNSVVYKEFAINFKIIQDFLEESLQKLPKEYKKLMWLDLFIKKTNLNFYILGDRLSITPTLISTCIPQVRNIITGPYFLHMMTKNINEKSIIFMKDNIDFVINYEFNNKEKEALFFKNIQKSYLSGIDNILSLLGPFYEYPKIVILFLIKIIFTIFIKIFFTFINIYSFFKKTIFGKESEIIVQESDKNKHFNITDEKIHTIRNYRNRLINLSINNDLIQSKGLFFSNYPIHYLADKFEYKIQSFFYKLSSDLLFRIVDYVGRNEEYYFPEEIILNKTNNKLNTICFKSLKNSINKKVTLPHIIIEGGMNISMSFIRNLEYIINDSTKQTVYRTNIQDPLRVTNILLNQKNIGKTSMNVGTVAKKSFSNIFQHNLNNLKSVLSIHFLNENDNRLSFINKFYLSVVHRLYSFFSGGSIFSPWKKRISMVVIENINRFLGQRKKNDMDNIKTSGVHYLLGIITQQVKHFLLLQCYDLENVDSAIKSRMDFSIVLTIREHDEYQTLLRRNLLEIIRENPNLLNFSDEKFEIYVFELTQVFRKKYVSIRMLKELMNYYINIQGKEKGTNLKIILELINNDRRV
ncbi:hypothetical protein AB836_00905 [Rickettsiales bacterium (ex Bugula neritina AB1)]|nr:hypothetical protein AB836_00905 [Rickettsiales bacterium (ex Bugula neritina AB1)]